MKHTSGNSLSPSGAQNKDIDAASQTLLTEVKLRLRHSKLEKLKYKKVGGYAAKDQYQIRMSSW